MKSHRPLHCCRWASWKNEVTRYTPRMRLLFGVLLLLSFTAHAEFIGKLVAVSDGDTITVLREKEQIKIRPVGSDAPEKAPAFGKILKRELRDNFALPPDL